MGAIKIPCSSVNGEFKFSNLGTVFVAPLPAPPPMGGGVFDGTGTWTLSNYSVAGWPIDWERDLGNGDTIAVLTETGYQVFEVTGFVPGGDVMGIVGTQVTNEGVLYDGQTTGVWKVTEAALPCAEDDAPQVLELQVTVSPDGSASAEVLPFVGINFDDYMMYFKLGGIGTVGWGFADPSGRRSNFSKVGTDTMTAMGPFNGATGPNLSISYDEPGVYTMEAVVQNLADGKRTAAEAEVDFSAACVLSPIGDYGFALDGSVSGLTFTYTLEPLVPPAGVCGQMANFVSRFDPGDGSGWQPTGYGGSYTYAAAGTYMYRHELLNNITGEVTILSGEATVA